MITWNIRKIKYDDWSPWKRWFAWRPVVVYTTKTYHKMVWLCIVEYRSMFHCGMGGSWTEIEYREIETDE